MMQEKNRIVIIWSGTINNLNLRDQENIQIFQNIGMDNVRAVMESLDFRNISAVVGAPGIISEIRKYALCPVFIAYPHYMDILETVRDAEIRLQLENQKIALILHESNSINPERLSYFVHNEVHLFKFTNKEQIRRTVGMLSEQGYAMVVGGPTIVGIARDYGIPTAQLIYGEQALMEALQKAREILGYMQKETRQTQKLKALFDIIPDGVIETDETGRIGLCNRKTMELLGLCAEELAGRNICDILGDQSWERVYRDRELQADRLITYQKTKFFSTRQPILEEGEVIGSVGTLQEAEKIRSMERKFRSHQNRGLVAKYRFGDIVGESEVMREIVRRTRGYAQYDATVLLEGETGTGKEIFAQSIHNESRRKNGPFVAINCAALAENLLESELMGYDEGAFTGAKKGGKAGLFERAHKGTIFLDEINQLSINLQSKLLRVIQEKSVMHVGGDSVIPVDVRIIAATNEQLRQMVSAGTFRNDLYYRLNVLNLRLPPLRERREDIPLLMSHFAGQISGVNQTERQVEQMLAPVQGYHWPGNIRELQNYVERYLILGEENVSLDHYFFSEFTGEGIYAPVSAASAGDDSYLVRADTLTRMERELISKVVERCDGNRTRAAYLLDISRNTVSSKLSD